MDTFSFQEKRQKQMEKEERNQVSAASLGYCGVMVLLIYLCANSLSLVAW